MVELVATCWLLITEPEGRQTLINLAQVTRIDSDPSGERTLFGGVAEQPPLRVPFEAVLETVRKSGCGGLPIVPPTP